MTDKIVGVPTAVRRWLVASLLLTSIGFAQPPSGYLRQFEEADRHVRRLAPSAFPELPSHLRQELERRGCTIPQVWADTKPHNVIKGEFITTGQTDWAVLCSLKRVSSILVFRNASALNPFELAREPDLHKLQGVGNGEIGYSRAIAPANRAFILSHDHNGTAPARIDHDGINDAFVGKASVVPVLSRWKMDGADGSRLVNF